MNPLFEIILFIFILFAGIMGICFVISVIVTSVGIRVVDSVSRKNARKIYSQLPQRNCGECECESCMHYAQWVADERRELGKCPHLSEETVSAINDLFPKAELRERPKLKDMIKGWLRREK